MIRGHVPFHTSPSQVTTGVPQLSLADHLRDIRSRNRRDTFKVRSAGHVIVGGVISFTVISCTQVVVLPQLIGYRYRSA